jgi:hypothetical protein
VNMDEIEPPEGEADAKPVKIPIISRTTIFCIN